MRTPGQGIRYKDEGDLTVLKKDFVKAIQQ